MQNTTDLTQYGAIAVLAVIFFERSLSFALKLMKRRTGESEQPLSKVLDDIRNDVRATRKGVWALVQRGRMIARCDDGPEYK